MPRFLRLVLMSVGAGGMFLSLQEELFYYTAISFLLIITVGSTLERKHPRSRIEAIFPEDDN